MTQRIELDWAAPIVPDHSMMGLVLGTARQDVLDALLSQPKGHGPETIVFRNSPELRVESDELGGILLRAIGIAPVHYPWQNQVATLSFRNGLLSNIEVVRLWGDESFAYRGLLFGKVGLGSPVADLLGFCELAYSNADEWFYPTAGVTGLIVAGSSVDLVEDPHQQINLLWVFDDPRTDPHATQLAPDVWVKLSPEGGWTCAAVDDFCDLTDSRQASRLLPLLDLDLEDVRAKVNALEAGRSVATPFPFIEVVRSGLKNDSDHWVGRALEWFTQLPDEDQGRLEDGLVAAASARGVNDRRRRAAHGYLNRVRGIAVGTLPLEVLCADGTKEYCSIELAQPREQAFLFTGMGWTQRQFAGIDIFDSLILLRRVLEELGARALCAGARLDTYPSAVTRDMGGGRKVYITRMGMQAKREDILDIFDRADAEQVATVTEQREYHAQWFGSLGRTE